MTTFNNYTLADLAESLLAIVMFFPVLFVPGYVIGWVTSCFRFRELSPRWRSLLSIPLSMAVCPATIYWLASFAGWPGVSVLFLAFFAYWLWMLWGNAGHERWSIWLEDIKAVNRGVWLIGLAWAVIVLASLLEIQLKGRLYFSVTSFDHAVRTAITETIAKVGSHPNNPFYYLTGPVPLRYHFFWFLPCGFIAYVMDGLTPAKTCIYGSAVWCGWGFLALIAATFRFLLGFAGEALRRRIYLAIAFTAVTGLDLLPTAYAYHRGTVYPDMEWWNINQITSWWDTALWVPHHFAALVIGVTGVLVCWDARTATTRKSLITHGLLAGLVFGSLVGTSVYVGFVTAAFLAVWTGLAALKREARQFVALAISGCLSIVIAVPYLHSLSGKGDGGAFMTFSVRHFWLADEFVAAHDLGQAWSLVLRLVGAPVNYFVELGFFFVVGLVFLWKAKVRRNLSPALQLTVLLAGISVFIATFFRSGVIWMNDLGVRGLLPAQFVLLLWAADLFGDSSFRTPQVSAHTPRSIWKWGWALLLVFGVGGTIYQVSILRIHGMLADRGLIRPWFVPDRHLGERTFALRQAYDAAKIVLPADAVIQNNPKWTYDDIYFGLYSDRQTAAYDPSCGAQFGGDPKACAQMFPALADLFADSTALDLKGVTELCNTLSIRALVIKDKDGIWNREPTWLRSLPVIVENAYARIVKIPADQRVQASSARAIHRSPVTGSMRARAN
ncbi:MAG: hypothetical protein ACJ746_27600 [Bryobacteraceae bacterium]